MVFGLTRSIGGASPEAAERLEAIRRRQDALVSAVLLASARELGGEPDPLEVSAVTRGLNGVYEGLVEWWGEHPDVSARAAHRVGDGARPPRARGDGGVAPAGRV